MEFTVVILSEQVGSYPKINWTEWKDRNRKQMKSQGDVWSMATLSGATIWDCLDNNKIDRLHLVQWKPVEDTMYQVSLPCRCKLPCNCLLIAIQQQKSTCSI